MQKTTRSKGHKVPSRYGDQKLKNLHRAEKNAKARMAGKVHGTTEKSTAMLRRILMTGEIKTAKMYDHLVS